MKHRTEIANTLDDASLGYHRDLHAGDYTRGYFDAGEPDSYGGPDTGYDDDSFIGYDKHSEGEYGFIKRPRSVYDIRRN